MMKKLLIAVLTLLTIQVQGLKADFYVIPVGTQHVGTAITSLPYTISTPGFYYLIKDLQTNTDGILIRTNNVTLDLMGHTISGTGKADGLYKGVQMDGRNIEVRNGTITQFAGYGIYNPSIYTNHRIFNIRAISNGAIGIYTVASNSQIKKCTVSDNGTGIHTYSNVLLTENTVTSNDGIGIDASYHSIIKNNIVNSNGGDGIRVGSGCYIEDNVISYNSAYGIDNYILPGYSNYNFIQSNSLISNSSGNIETCVDCNISNNLTAP